MTIALRAVAGLVVILSLAMPAQQVPVLNFEADVNFLKLPQDLHLGEVTGLAVNSQKHLFVFSRGNTTGPAYGASAAQLLEFGPDGRFVREIGKNLYAWSFAHAVRVDREDNIWAVDKGSDMIIKFNPEGRVVMVFGRKQEASDEETGPLKHPNPLPATDRRDVGSRGQHLHQRRLHQLTGRQGGQERHLGQIVGPARE
jgi:hypothetical protein